jgi:hypothetical protein
MLRNKALLATGATAGGAAALGSYAGTKAAQPKTAGAVGRLVRDPRTVGALIGAGTGAGVTALEGAGHGPDLEKFRAKTEQKAEKMKQPGARNFARSLDVGADRQLLTMGETVKAHPVLSTIAAGVAGGVGGYAAGHEIPALLREAKSLRSGPWPRTV